MTRLAPDGQGSTRWREEGSGQEGMGILGGLDLQWADPATGQKIGNPLKMSKKCLMVTFRVLQEKCQKNVPEGTQNVKKMS